LSGELKAFLSNLAIDFPLGLTVLMALGGFRARFYWAITSPVKTMHCKGSNADV